VAAVAAVLRLLLNLRQQEMAAPVLLSSNLMRKVNDE
jgi:hypothetical protein